MSHSNIKLKSNQRRHSVIVAAFISVIIFLSIILLGCVLFMGKSKKSENIVAKINNEEISAEEFSLFLEQNRALTYQYFNEKYQAEFDNGFWNKSFNGEIPIEKLKADSLKQLIKIKTEQQLMKHYKIVKDISYNYFLAELKKENKRRADAIEKGQPVYGVKQYSEKEYYDYLHSNNLIQLKKEIYKDKFQISDKQLEDYYLATRDNYMGSQAGGSYKPYSEVKDVFLQRYIEEKYTVFIENEVSNAKVEKLEGFSQLVIE